MSVESSSAAQTGAMLANRLRKNAKHLAKWLKREGIHCYRLYDADIPEFAVAVDVYHGVDPEQAPWVHVQEYEPPKHVDAGKARARLNQALNVIAAVLEVSEDRLFVKVRRQQKGSAQYEKLAHKRRFYEVMEGGLRFWVNFEDYLDTGLFLDHRITRAMLAALAGSKRFLNLFAYTGSATVYAAAGGARRTTTVDMSNTYLDWAKRNMAANGFTSSAHEFIQADCVQWLKQAADGNRRYGLIFLDPPSFSTSKRMNTTFDVQRDHVKLLMETIRLLEPGGVLIFSNNRRRFKFDYKAFEHRAVRIEDITKQTLPKDFERNPRIHHCWKITA